jgi:ribulose bisphosphate carboxylase small subunit
LDALKVINRHVAEKAEILFFDLNWKTLKALTTNKNILLINQVKEKVEYKGYKIDFYYTDEEAFSFAITWYDYLKSLESRAKKEIEELKTASGANA